MTYYDHYGNPISTNSQSATDAYNKGVRLFLSADYGAMEAFQSAIDADPDFALGHAGLARALMMTGQMASAKTAIARAAELASNGQTREQQHVNAINLLLSGEAQKARTAVLAHVRDHPRDALVAQLCANVFGLIGFSGEVGREAELLAYTSALLPHYGQDWWMMSMHALSLCETGQISQSIELMERSLALNGRNANAAHFKAHAQYEAGDTIAGRTYLEGWLADYDDRGVLHGHLNWHVALWALQTGDQSAMWNAVDMGVRPGAAKGLPINILTDTAAILYRAELAGMAVQPQRWMELSDYAVKFFPETGQSFADMHAALSHAMAGQGERLAHIAETAKGFAGDLVRPLARAWGEIARENWASALDELVPVMGTAERLGGSRAQRDLLELTYANVLMKLGQSQEARRNLSMRRHILANAPPIAAFN